MLDGMFSFVLLDESVQPPRVIAARDPIGITTLYQGWKSSAPGRVYFASELKALVDECDKIISFPPGHVFDSATGKTTRYFRPSWWHTDPEGGDPRPTNAADLVLLRETLEAAVRKRLMSEVPYGVLLSGGLDSSLIAAIAARETDKAANAQLEARKRLANETGLMTPPGVLLDGKWLTELAVPVSDHLHSAGDGMATVALVFCRPGKLARSSCRAQGCCISRHCASRIHFHCPRRPGRPVGCHLPSGNLRRDDSPCKYAYVSFEP